MKSSDLPLITIGLTCYNAKDTIARAIESALAQDYPNKEIVLVDDCSQDASLDIIKNYPEVRVILHEVNKGTAESRNTLINNANGKYIVFFDDDDYSYPTRVSKQVAAMEAFYKTHDRNTPVMSFCSVEVVKNAIKIEKKHATIGFDKYKISNSEEIIKSILLHHWHCDFKPRLVFGTLNAAFRIADIKKAGGFDPAFRRAEDTDLILRLAKLGGHNVPVADVLVTQYITETEDKKPDLLIKFRELLYNKYKDLIEKQSNFNDVFAFEIAYLKHILGQSHKDLVLFCLKRPHKFLFQVYRLLRKRLSLYNA